MTYALEFFVQTTPPRETPATPTSGLYIERQNKIDPVLGVSRSQLVPEETFKIRYASLSMIRYKEKEFLIHGK